MITKEIKMKNYIPKIKTVENFYYAIQLIKEDGTIRYFGSDDFNYKFSSSLKMADLYAESSLHSLNEKIKEIKKYGYGIRTCKSPNRRISINKNDKLKKVKIKVIDRILLNSLTMEIENVYRH